MEEESGEFSEMARSESAAGVSRETDMVSRVGIMVFSATCVSGECIGTLPPLLSIAPFDVGWAQPTDDGLHATARAFPTRTRLFWVGGFQKFSCTSRHLG